MCKDMVLLDPNILVAAKEDHLILYDVREAKKARVVEVKSPSERPSYIKSLKLSSASHAVVCDLGYQLCVIHFPGLTEKSD